MPWFRRKHDQVLVEVEVVDGLILARPQSYSVDLAMLEGNYEPHDMAARKWMIELRAELEPEIEGPKDA